MGAAIFSIGTGKSRDTFDGSLATRHDAMQREASAAAPVAVPKVAAEAVVVIGAGTLARDCLLRCLDSSDLNCAASGYGAVADWEPADPAEAVTVLLYATGDAAKEQTVANDVAALKAKAANARIVVVSDIENAVLVRRALEEGAQGYVGTSFNLDMTVAAIRLVQTGEKFVPVTSLLSAQAGPEPTQDKGAFSHALSQRQVDVIDRLRRGESNKIIAYNLGMSESTVKIHIRNIMRKIKARNRTEVAILTKDMFE